MNPRLQNYLEMLFVEFKLGRAFLIELVAKFVEFFGQDWCSTVKNSCSTKEK